MPIDSRIAKAQVTAIRNALGADWGRKYPSFTHRKDHPVLRPKLFCRIVDMGYNAGVVSVKARIDNIGSGASYNTKVHHYYAVVPVQMPGIPRQPLHKLLELKSTETISIHPGETREIVFSTDQPFVINEWQSVVLCYDPLADTLPMDAWHTLIQPLDNLLQGADNPPDNPPIPHWDEFDGTDSMQPLMVNNRTWRGRRTDPEPPVRIALGLPGPNPSYFQPHRSSTVSELRQTVAVDRFRPLVEQGDLTFTLRGFIRSYPQRDPDLAQMILECMDANGNVLDTLDLGAHAFTDAWHLLSGTFVAPVATNQVRIRLRSTRRSAINNDGYYDAIRLLPGHRQVATAMRTSFS